MWRIDNMQSRYFIPDSLSCFTRNEQPYKTKVLCVHYQGISVINSRPGIYISQIFQVTGPLVSEFIQLRHVITS